MSGAVHKEGKLEIEGHVSENCESVGQVSAETETLEEVTHDAKITAPLEKRQHRRKAAIWKCEIVLNNSVRLFCESRNVSRTGALLKTTDLIENNLTVDVYFHVYHNGENRLLKIKSNIVRVTFDHDLFNVAVNFLEDGSDDVEFLEKYSKESN